MNVSFHATTYRARTEADLIRLLFALDVLQALTGKAA